MTSQICFMCFRVNLGFKKKKHRLYQGLPTFFVERIHFQIKKFPRIHSKKKVLKGSVFLFQKNHLEPVNIMR